MLAQIREKTAMNAMTSINAATAAWTCFKVTIEAGVAHIQMNRPDAMNAMNRAFWREIRECFERVDDDSDTRVVLLSGAGKNFTGGVAP
jgi:enoyl-CoA hydratase